MQTSETVDKLFAALAKAQAEFLPIIKNRSARVRMKSGGEYTYEYADYEAILQATRPALSKYGLCTLQILDGENLTTVIGHDSGERIVSSGAVGKVGEDPREFGSRLTYLRRYQLGPLLNVSAEEDNDAGGNEAERGAAAKKSNVGPGSGKPKDAKPTPEQEREAMARVAKVEAATTVDELRAVYGTAFDAQTLVGFPALTNLIIAAKGTRYKQLVEAQQRGGQA